MSDRDTFCGGSAPTLRGEPWRSMYAPGFPDFHPEHVAEDLLRGCRPAETSGGRAETMGGDAGFDSFDRLPNLRAPHARRARPEDQAIAPENGELLAGRIPGAELLLLEGAGHLYHSEQAGRADAAVLDFIRRHGDA